MGRKYKHLSQVERDQIALLRAQKWTFEAIGEKLGRNKSTVSREHNRNRESDGSYLPSCAQTSASERKKAAGKRASKCEPYAQAIHDHLREGWTPAQIAGHLTRYTRGFSVCHETVYEYIYQYQIQWALMLPRKHRPRWTKGMGKKHTKREMIPNRVSILERAESINNKSVFGHWEGDSIVCSQSTVSLNVLVERQTQYVRISRVENRGPGATRDAMIASLSSYEVIARLSVTLDNGIEFKWHEEVKEALKLDTYFCQPYHSWEKGLVEQVNGLIRRYLPKKTDLSQVSEKEIRAIEYLLNSRPRKLLKWRTPAEVFAKKSKMKWINGAVAT